MNPERGMLGYTIAFWALALVAVVLGARLAILVLAVAVFVWTSAQWAVYRHKRQEFGRARSEKRKRGDEFVAAEAIISTSTLIGAALTLVLIGWTPTASGVSVPRLAQGFSVGAAGFALLFGSSVFDWCWILPRRNGLICEPPCITSGHPQWRRLTKAWLWHRCIATIVGTLLFVLGTALLLWGLAPDIRIEGPAGFGSIAGVIAVVAAVLRFTPYSETLTTWSAFGPPTLCVGDQLTGTTSSGAKVNGMLVDMALDQVEVAAPGGHRRTFPLAGLLRGAVEPATFRGCSSDECSHVIEDCERRKFVANANGDTSVASLGDRRD